MNKKVFFALLLAFLLPLSGYWLVKYYSKDAVHMPRHYFYDEVVSKSGKADDTLWHQVKGIPFTNQLGQHVTLEDLHGKILVVDFFFTRCPTLCPGLARSMKKLQDSFLKNDSIVQFLSISIDPEHDSVPNLRKFADRYNANHDTWWFLTGNKQQIYNFAIKEMRSNIADPGVDTAFIHTPDFFLLDSNRIVRGWYDGRDSAEMAQLAADIPTLMLERDKKSPSILRDFIPILPLIFVGIAMVMLLVALLNRNKNKNRTYAKTGFAKERPQG